MSPSRIDEALPLVPATVWIYASYIAISAAALFAENDRGQLNRFFYALLAANLLSALVFVFWPTTFVRPHLDPQQGGASVALLRFIWMVDEPVNCFPSLHVSSSVLAALMMWRGHPRLRFVFAFWALAIAISTMTIKQHHSADVLAGACVAAAMYWIFFVRAFYCDVVSRGDSSQ